MAIQRILNPKFYTGLESEKPATLSEGQVFIASDTGEIFTQLNNDLKSSLSTASRSANNSSEYIAQLTQSGTSDPVSNVLLNQTGLDFNWVRTGEGAYSVSFTGDYTERLLVNFPTQNIDNSAAAPKLFNYSIEDTVAKDNTTTLNVYTTNEYRSDQNSENIFEESDGLMTLAFIKVTVL